MYCSDCGQPARGKFCSHCGHRLDIAAPPPPPERPHDPDEIAVEIIEGWEDEVRYEELVRVPEIKAQIERHQAQAKKGISGEQVLAVYGKVISSPVPLDKLATIIQPLYGRLGIKTGKERKIRIDAPVGRVMVRALCSLARHSQAVRKVSQATDGCCFEAVLPSDVCALEGNLLVTVRRDGRRTEVTAATNIPGQWFDWGKSTRCLERLVTDLHSDPA